MRGRGELRGPPGLHLGAWAMWAGESWGSGRGLTARRAHAMGVGATVAGEGTGLTSRARESARGRARACNGPDRAVPLGREGEVDRASATRRRQMGTTCPRTWVRAGAGG
jgi:hypothetical protein